MIKLMTPVFRVSFPNVFEAVQFNGQGKFRYGLTMLFSIADIQKDPGELAKWKAMRAALETVAREQWPKVLPTTLINPFRKGEEKEQHAGYGPGIVFARASTLTRPGVVDETVNPILFREQFYAGCYARAMVNPYPNKFPGKSGVLWGLQNVQKVKDGDPFGGRSNAESDFNAVDGAVSEDVKSTTEDALFG